MRVFIIFGPPGVGKGTQAKLISDRLGIEHVSTGVILRGEIAKKSEIGKKVENITKSGGLVSDDLIMKIVEKHISESSAEGFLFDGVPRTIAQAKIFMSIMQNKSVSDIKVINLDAAEDELLIRLLKRAEIEGRADDNEKTIKNRIEIYHSQTKPVIDFFKRKNIFIVDVDGIGSVEEINKNIIESI